MAEEIMIEQQLDFMYNEEAGVWVSGIAEIAALPEKGTKLAVCFDKAEYACTVNYDETMAVLWAGNGSLFGLAGGGDMPFFVQFAEDDGVRFAAFATAETGESHTVSVSAAKEADGIVIRNPLGKEVTYGEYTKILLNRKSGTQSIFSLGDAQDKTVEDMDFKEGDITLVPDEGTLFSAVTLKKPADLVAENIALGKTIAGVEGSFEGAKDPVLNLAQTQLPFALDADWGKYMYTGEGITYIVPDAGYTVTYGESTHSLKSVWVDGLGRAVLGNTAFWGGEDTGRPFMIAVNDSKDMWVVDMYSQPEGVNMAVSLVTETQTGGSSTLELEETTLAFAYMEDAAMFMNTDSILPDIRAGATYDVSWDGTVYTCTAIETVGYDDADNAIAGAALGNVAITEGGDTGEPFLYMAYDTMKAMVSLFDTEAAEHTVSIKLNFAAGGGEETQPAPVLIKQVSGISSSATDLITLVTKEELESIGFDISKKCFLTTYVGDEWYSYTTSFKTIISLNITNYLMTTHGGSNPSYGCVLYASRMSNKSYQYTQLITGAHLGAVNTEYPYYDADSHEIRYNPASSFKFNKNATTTATVYIVVGMLQA